MSVCCRTKVFGSLQEREGCNEHKDTRCVITPKPINVNTDSNIAYLQWLFCFIAWSMILFSFIYFYIIFLYVRGSILKGAFQFHYQFTSLMQGYLTCKNSWQVKRLKLGDHKRKACFANLGMEFQGHGNYQEGSDAIEVHYGNYRIDSFWISTKSQDISAFAASILKIHFFRMTHASPNFVKVISFIDHKNTNKYRK